MTGRRILEPIRIKSMELKNRIAWGPILSQPKGKDLGVGENTIRWWEERAKGGFGFIMSGTFNPSPAEAQRTAIIGEMIPASGSGAFHDDKYIANWPKAVEVVHRHGCKIGIQIAIAGATIGPSPSPHPKEEIFQLIVPGVELPTEEVSVEQIEEYENDCARAAARAKEAGIDCVELHCAHGGITLHGGFISPFTNRRTDKYGGDWEGRLRFPVETLHKIRKAVGEDYPILVRISADELLGNLGITLEDTINFVVPILERTKVVDCFDLSQGAMMHNPDGITIPLYYHRGCFIHIAEAVKKVTKIPVIAAGRITMELADKYLDEEKADIIYLGRQPIADPETPKKYFEGKPENIRECIGDLRGMDGCVPCTINYDAGKEGQSLLTPTERSKKVLVIGGGVAGMETARIAALRGHKTTLIEKESELGGLVLALSRDPLLAEFRNIVDFLSNQMKKLGVDVKLGQEATPELVQKYKADAVILATGATMVVPNVAKGKPNVITHVEALKKKDQIGNRLIIWGLLACELAISYAQEGKDVTLIGKGDENALGKPYLSPPRRVWILKRLSRPNFAETRPMTNPKVLLGVEVKDITPEGVMVIDQEKKKRVLTADTIIVSLGRKREASLFAALQGKVAELYQVGDCSKIEDIKTAIHGANEIARKL